MQLSEGTIAIPDTSFGRRFWAFHEENPRVYELFCRFTQEAIDAGRERLGARLVWERIRWYTLIETTDPDFKINDHYIAYYARLWAQEHPRYSDFFRFRELRAQ
jgi:hypothetical protein